jgi:hypothetical protein
VNDSFYEELDHIFNKVPKYHTKILLGDFHPKAGMQYIFKSTTGNEYLHKISNYNEVILVNIATFKNLTVKVLCSHIATSINILEHLQMGKPRFTIF